ncbi:MAG: right-handed parallel beta-helix repeat-containing protein [Methanobacteriaceae archaeon]|nr:right-handed parallel beta-helix repeat-containing protein [Methanobacteriaceae archaeon]
MEKNNLKSKKFLFFAVLTIVLTLSLGTVSAANIDVNPGDSIQSAVDSAVDGDTIIVHDNAGSAYTYNENIKIKDINGLSIISDGTVIVSATGGSAKNDKPVFQVDKKADNIVINGFSITGATKSSGVEVKNKDSTSIFIINNLIYGNEVGVTIKDGTATIKDNKIYGNKKNGVNLEKKEASAEITNNKIYDNGENGINVQSGKATIKDNEIFGNKKKNGVNVDGKEASAEITNNKIYDNGENGINVKDGTATILYNDIYSNTKDGIKVEKKKADDKIIGNNIHNNGKNGINVKDANPVISHNRIVGNTEYGILWDSDANGVAINNWWGDNSGPALPNDVNVKKKGTLDVTKWLVLKIYANPTSIMVGQSSTITADLTYNNFDELTYLAPDFYHVPNNIPVVFNTDIGILGSTTITKYTLNGIATASLLGNIPGIAHVTATVDRYTTSPHAIVNILAASSETVNAAGTIGMQPTGLPLGLLALAVLLIIGGIFPLRK